MIKSRVYSLFESFSAKERRAFKKFVRSPFHNAREDARLLYEYLLENHRKLPLLDRKLAYSYICTEQQFNDAKFRQVMTHLCRLMEKYLAVSHLMRDDVKMKLLTARALKDKKMREAAVQNLEKAEALVNNNTLRNRAYFEAHYQILSEKHLISGGKERNKQLDMAPLNEALEISFIIEKLMRSCYMLSHQNVMKVEHAHGLTNTLILYIEKENLLRIPAVRLYYSVYHVLLPDSEEQWFYSLKEQLIQYGSLFKKEELSFLFRVPINYAVKKGNDGQVNFVEELFSLYQFGLEHNLFLQNKEISRFAYKNIIASSLVLEEFEWAERFMHEYKKFLAPAYRESHYSYNFAKLHYSRKDYEAAMQLLTKVEYDDLFLNISSKILLLKIYFETKEWDALDSLLSSFKTFLYRKKVIGYHKDIYHNITDLTRKLRTLGPHNKKEIKDFRKLVEKTQPNTERKWMLERLDELDLAVKNNKV